VLAHWISNLMILVKEGRVSNASCGRNTGLHKITCIFCPQWLQVKLKDLSENWGGGELSGYHLQIIFNVDLFRKTVIHLKKLFL